MNIIQKHLIFIAQTTVQEILFFMKNNQSGDYLERINAVYYFEEFIKEINNVHKYDDYELAKKLLLACDIYASEIEQTLYKEVITDFDIKNCVQEYVDTTDDREVMDNLHPIIMSHLTNEGEF